MSPRWQFGLRTLLLATLTLCLALGYLSYLDRQHRKLIAELNALGIQVEVSTPPERPKVNADMERISKELPEVYQRLVIKGDR